MSANQLRVSVAHSALYKDASDQSTRILQVVLMRLITKLQAELMIARAAAASLAALR